MNKLTVSNMLKELGISPALLGYRYIFYAVELIHNNTSYMYKITKKLYPAIAEKFNTTTARVERAIRHAIETSWNKGSINLQKKLFGYTISCDKGSPTNAEFIVTLADYINMLEGEQNAQ